MKKIIVLMACVLWSCSSASPEDNPVLQEAYGIHQESVRIQEELKPLLDKIRIALASDQNGVSEANRTEMSLLLNDYTEWQKNLFEVPGFEHEHKAGEHHDHDHHPSPALPDDKVLAIQKEIRAGIRQLRDRSEKLALSIP